MTVKNVWANNEGTVVVDGASTGDLWIHSNHSSVLKHHKHIDAQLSDDAERIRRLKWSTNHVLNGNGIPPKPRDVWPETDGCYFAAAACGIGGFRGIPKFASLDGQPVGIYGNVGVGDGLAPAVTRLNQAAWLPDKSKGQIESELRDFNRWRSLIQNYKGEMCRPN